MRIVVATVAALSFLLPVPASAALRDREGTAIGGSGCVWSIQRWGAAPLVHAEAGAMWHSRQSVEVYSATNRTEVIDCGPSGRAVAGGTLQVGVSITVHGQGIDSCSLGFPSIVSCTINTGSTLASVTYTSEKKENTGAPMTHEIGGFTVRTGLKGNISSVEVNATAEWVYGNDTRVAIANVPLKY
jgi:hypothetical protein